MAKSIKQRPRFPTMQKKRVRITSSVSFFAAAFIQLRAATGLL